MKITKLTKIIGAAILTAVATTLVAQTIPCVVFVSHNCPGSVVINGVTCLIESGMGYTYNTLESGTGYAAFQTICPEYACFYNCNGTTVSTQTTYKGTINCFGGQVGFCD
jgi:hypothetical protein